MQSASIRQAGFARSLRIQRNAIGALLMREVITRYGRHNLGFAWLFLEPMLFTLGIAALWTATRDLHGSSLSVLAFALTGYSSVLVWRNCAHRCVSALEPNLSLLYHRNVRVLDIFAARILLEIAGVTISFAVLLGGLAAGGWLEPPADLLTLLAGWVLLGWFGAALGLVLGALAARTELVDRLWHAAAYLLFPLSGAVYMVDWLPRAWQPYALALPMVHGVEMLRAGYFGSSVVARFDVGYLVLACMVLTVIGLSALRSAAHLVEPR